MRPASYLAAVANGPRASRRRPRSEALAKVASSIVDTWRLVVPMDSSPFAAKAGKVVQEVCLDPFQLPQPEPDVAQQPYLPKVAEQFKPRVLSGSDHVHMRRMVIVRIDHHAPALENRENDQFNPSAVGFQAK